MHGILYKPGNCTEGALEDFKVKIAKFKMNMENSLTMLLVAESKELKSRRMSNIQSPLKHHLEKMYHSTIIARTKLSSPLLKKHCTPITVTKNLLSK